MHLRGRTFLALALVLVIALSVPMSAFAGAVVVGDNTSFTIDFIEYIPCAANGAGEEVLVTGLLHDMYRAVHDGNGGFHLVLLSQPMGVEGVGQTTGDMYRGTGVLMEQNHYLGLGETSSFIYRFHFIGQGPGNNYYVQLTNHVTVNANGELTAYVDNWSVECK